MKQHQAGLGAKDLCRKYGISDATFYKWRSKYGGMKVSDARKLKAPEEENRKLKKLLAEHDPRLLAIFEGRDAIGKNCSFKRIAEHLSPSETRVGGARELSCKPQPKRG